MALTNRLDDWSPDGDGSTHALECLHGYRQLCRRWSFPYRCSHIERFLPIDLEYADEEQMFGDITECFDQRLIGAWQQRRNRCKRMLDLELGGDACVAVVDGLEVL